MPKPRGRARAPGRPALGADDLTNPLPRREQPSAPGKRPTRGAQVAPTTTTAVNGDAATISDHTADPCQDRHQDHAHAPPDEKPPHPPTDALHTSIHTNRHSTRENIFLLLPSHTQESRHRYRRIRSQAAISRCPLPPLLQRDIKVRGHRLLLPCLPTVCPLLPQTGRLARTWRRLRGTSGTLPRRIITTTEEEEHPEEIIIGMITAADPEIEAPAVEAVTTEAATEAVDSIE